MDDAVLVYASGRYNVVHEGQSVEVPPGLSVLSLDQWALVAEQERGAQLVQEVAGLERPLADAWADVPPRQVEAWLGRTRDARALEAVLEVETRPQVAAAIRERQALCGFVVPAARPRRVVRRG